MTWPRPSIRQLLLGVNVSILSVPILAVVFLRIYDTHLIQQTERQLIAEAVLIGEVWRDRWLEHSGLATDTAPSIRPSGDDAGPFFPIEPILDLSEGTLPPISDPPSAYVEPSNEPAWLAGSQIMPLLERAQTVNLSGVRVLDHSGCVVATTGNDLGACLGNLPEVAEGLAGRYSAVARERISDEPAPPLTSISRRGKIRVFCVIPIFSDGKVVGAVRMSRTALDPLKSLWFHSHNLLVALMLCVALTIVISLFLSYAITRPVAAITAAAQVTARGEERKGPLVAKGLVPDEVHRLGAALELMTAQLTQRANYIADFAATVSHELKTPLTGIRGATELLQESGQQMSDEQRSRFLSNIDADAEHMEQLVTRLLLLARIQNTREAEEPINLLAFFSQLKERYGDALQVSIVGVPSLTINRAHLESAVRNLIDNGIRHGNGQPVEVMVSDRNGRLEVTVRDHGRGISNANRERIFERFFTTERDLGGTGLGLAIVKAVADNREGSVSLATGPEGTTFTLLL
ncbi:MAG: hypothetical protein A2289_15870 [Deltaproteobacteria bacterium RIFOXYA12_FULL_58_15]|nr:MAG: hypothetical protein A2289_15870 [Deltaproteobacteria bacterium RIFOXYA12_FULL_58_15]